MVFRTSHFELTTNKNSSSIELPVFLSSDRCSLISQVQPDHVAALVCRPEPAVSDVSSAAEHRSGDVRHWGRLRPVYGGRVYRLLSPPGVGPRGTSGVGPGAGREGRGPGGAVDVGGAERMNQTW